MVIYVLHESCTHDFDTVFLSVTSASVSELLGVHHCLIYYLQPLLGKGGLWITLLVMALRCSFMESRLTVLYNFMRLCNLCLFYANKELSPT